MTVGNGSGFDAEAVERDIKIMEAVEREESAELAAWCEHRSVIEAENERKGVGPKTQSELESLMESSYEAEVLQRRQTSGPNSRGRRRWFCTCRTSRTP